MISSKPIRVGFVIFPIHLLGLHNYLRNLLAAVTGLQGAPITPVLFAGHKHRDTTHDFPGVLCIRSAMFDRKSPAWFLRKAVHRMTGRDLLLERLLLSHDIEILSHSVALGRGARVKTAGWIADLQHTRLPELFTPQDRASRDRIFGALCTCDRVIVSSECGREDVAAFAPQAAAATRVLHFVASPASLANAAALADLQQRYNFSGRFFLLPNQFWAHKNHRVVLEALALLKARGEEVLVLVTGSTAGSQESTQYASVMQLATERGVLDSFRVLGVIPFSDLVGLMTHAVALINPSLFEGWSTSVEESKSMGKTILLSDIPVHREQAPPRGIYFAPHDAQALADAIVVTRDGFTPDADEAAQAAARAEYPARLRAFGNTYLAIMQDLANSR